ncbi:hypothetical protein [Flavobacterium sp. ZS1P14]|uniref:hypothetical protein n=1 Tax=Flavobacterium sp. ZS1P14 TaxID=3401729 RepID=UPI003AAFFE4F
MKKTTSLLSAILLMMAVLTSCPSFGQMKMGSKKTVSVASAATLRTNMRKLWEDHVTWTRNVILCLVDELPGTDQAVKRLLQNQVDIGNAIKPYYGEDAGNKLTKLLKAHINISAEVVNAAEAGNTAALNKANKSWYANADEISEFLCKANPKWALADMKMMMNDHLKLTTNEAVQRIKKNYDADVIAYDKVHNEILEMSDMLADGIIKQFPEKFKPRIITKSSK